MLKYFFVLFISLTFSYNSWGQSLISIQALQLPAWVERDNERVPAYPGMQLKAKDVLKLGAEGKALLDLADGSIVKLGNNTAFEIDNFYVEASQQNLFTGALNILEGVFRFTTTERAKAQRRNIDIRTVTATVGIRGTDLWGQSDPERDFIVLIEGKIDVAKDGVAPVTMDIPLSIYDMPKDSSPQLGSIDMPTLLKFAPLTELDKGEGVMLRDGRYSVVVQSTLSEASALLATEKMHSLGFPATVSQALVNNQRFHRVSVDQFASLSDALSFSATANAVTGLNGAWIIKM